MRNVCYGEGSLIDKQESSRNRALAVCSRLAAIGITGTPDTVDGGIAHIAAGGSLNMNRNVG